MTARPRPGVKSTNDPKAASGQSRLPSPPNSNSRGIRFATPLHTESPKPWPSVSSPPRSILIKPGSPLSHKSRSATGPAPETHQSSRFGARPRTKEHWVIRFKSRFPQTVEIHTLQGELVVSNARQNADDLRRRVQRAQLIDFALPAKFKLLPGIQDTLFFPRAECVRSTHGLVPGCLSATSVIFPLDGLIKRWENKSRSDTVVFSTSTLRWPLRDTTFSVKNIPGKMIIILPIPKSEKGRLSLTEKTHKYTKWIDGLRHVGEPEESLAYPGQFFALAQSLMPLLVQNDALQVCFVGCDFLSAATHGQIDRIEDRIRGAFVIEYMKTAGPNYLPMLKRICFKTHSHYAYDTDESWLHTQPSEALCHPHVPLARRLLK